MIYQIAICDDCTEDRERLKRLLRGFEDEKTTFAITDFTSGEEILSAGLAFHMIFMDIHMDKMDGQETATQIRKKDRRVILSFYTGIGEPSSANFRVQPYRYIVKSMSDGEIKEDLAALINYLHEMIHRPALWAQAGRKEAGIRLDLDDIVYITKSKRTSVRVWPTREFMEKMGLEFQKTELTCEKQLGNVHELLEQHGFEYASSNYVVNFEHILAYARYEIHVKDYGFLSLTRSKTRQFRKRMGEYMLKKAGYQEGDEAARA
ncbi:MAG: response regulator [Lachnospiraceae bacterium]|jgi:DNA-binding LytR/AlgR family response regulator|nr:response regulator [Lachnospiraceae bacterium]